MVKVSHALNHSATEDNTYAAKKAQERKLHVAEMRMSRWMSGVAKMVRIRNGRIRGITSVRNFQESAGRYGHVMKRAEECVGE